MTSTVSARGADRIVHKLRVMREQKQFYEAHQNYRTIYFRYQSANRFEELRKLLLEGANWFLDMKEFNSGADMACLYINSLSNDPEIGKVLESKEEKFEVAKNIGVLFSKIPKKSPERMQFTVSALKLDRNHFDILQIHYRFAVCLWHEDNFPEARYHFLHSSPEAGIDCAALLIQYQVSRGSNSEADLFIVQFILQLLCARTTTRDKPTITQKNDLKLDTVAIISLEQALAIETLQIYTANHPQIRKGCPPFLHPLLNFVWLLLLSIQSAKSLQFRSLCELYATALSRDPEYKRYLSRIGELYFGIRPPSRNQAMGGILGNLLQSLVDDDDDVEEEQDSTMSRVNQADDDLD